MTLNLENAGGVVPRCSGKKVLQIANFAKFTGKQACNFINPLTTNVPHHTETSQLIYNANQLTDFYRMGNIGF